MYKLDVSYKGIKRIKQFKGIIKLGYVSKTIECETLEIVQSHIDLYKTLQLAKIIDKLIYAIKR